ncbi:MAG: hypothetical protein RLZZ244_744 [Verrucomicrobiota bacterium]|jgi:hypothetical protein
MILHGADRPELLRSESLFEILRESAAQFPQKAALISENSTLSYAELVFRAEALGEALVAQGAAPSKLIGGSGFPGALRLWWHRRASPPAEPGGFLSTPNFRRSVPYSVFNPPTFWAW